MKGEVYSEEVGEKKTSIMSMLTDSNKLICEFNTVLSCY